MINDIYGIANMSEFDLRPEKFPSMIGIIQRPSRKNRQRKKNIRRANSLAWQRVGAMPVQKQTDIWISEMSQAMWT